MPNQTSIYVCSNSNKWPATNWILFHLSLYRFYLFQSLRWLCNIRSNVVFFSIFLWKLSCSLVHYFTFNRFSRPLFIVFIGLSFVFCGKRKSLSFSHVNCEHTMNGVETRNCFCFTKSLHIYLFFFFLVFFLLFAQLYYGFYNIVNVC